MAPPRTLVRYEQLRSVESVAAPYLDEAKYAKGRYFIADCLPSDAVGNCIVFSGAAVLGIPQVTKTDIKTVGLTNASVGIIAEKHTTTRCVVMTFGELEIVSGSLFPGKNYWIGEDSNPTHILPIPDFGGKIACQIIGSAIDTTRLLINPERRCTIRTSP